MNGLGRIGLALILAGLLRAAAAQGIAPAAAIPAKGNLDFSARLNRVDGFGFSEAFGAAAAVRALPEELRREVLDLLLSRETGAGFNLLRLGIETGTSLEPVSPGGPQAAPIYLFDGDDGGQVWFAQQAKRYGVKEFLADAWSAPKFMKTKPTEIGGSLCGLTEAVCAGGDWTRAYAEYLLEYVRAYRRLGVVIRGLGFSNEPDIDVSYSSMLFSPEQAVEFLNVFGPAARKAGLKVTCCDASNWVAGAKYLEAMEAPSAKGSVDLYTVHEYGSHAEAPLKTGLPVWMTEWSSGVTVFHPEWDCGGCFGAPDGMSLAHDVIQALTKGQVNAYVYWWGSGTGPAALIEISADKQKYTVAKRLYALTGVSRFVRPGAYRVAAETSDPELELAGFVNANGSKVLVVLNDGRAEKAAEFAVEGSVGTAVRAYVTDTGRALTEEALAEIRGRVLAVKLPARSMTTVVLSR